MWWIEISINVVYVFMLVFVVVVFLFTCLPFLFYVSVYCFCSLNFMTTTVYIVYMLCVQIEFYEYLRLLRFTIIYNFYLTVDRLLDVWIDGCHDSWHSFKRVIMLKTFLAICILFHLTLYSCTTRIQQTFQLALIY